MVIYKWNTLEYNLLIVGIFFVVVALHSHSTHTHTHTLSPICHLQWVGGCLCRILNLFVPFQAFVYDDGAHHSLQSLQSVSLRHCPLPHIFSNYCSEKFSAFHWKPVTFGFPHHRSPIFGHFRNGRIGAKWTVPIAKFNHHFIDATYKPSNQPTKEQQKRRTRPHNYFTTSIAKMLRFSRVENATRQWFDVERLNFTHGRSAQNDEDERSALFNFEFILGERMSTGDKEKEILGGMLSRNIRILRCNIECVCVRTIGRKYKFIYKPDWARRMSAALWGILREHTHIHIHYQKLTQAALRCTLKYNALKMCSI